MGWKGKCRPWKHTGEGRDWVQRHRGRRGGLKGVGRLERVLDGGGSGRDVVGGDRGGQGVQGSP